MTRTISLSTDQVQALLRHGAIRAVDEALDEVRIVLNDDDEEGSE